MWEMAENENHEEVSGFVCNTTGWPLWKDVPWHWGSSVACNPVNYVSQPPNPSSNAAGLLNPTVRESEKVRIL